MCRSNLEMQVSGNAGIAGITCSANGPDRRTGADCRPLRYRDRTEVRIGSVAHHLAVRVTVSNDDLIAMLTIHAREDDRALISRSDRRADTRENVITLMRTSPAVAHHAKFADSWIA